MEDAKGKELITSLESKDYEKFRKILSGNPDYFRNMTTAKKDSVLRSLNYNKHTLAVLHILIDVKISDPLSTVNRFLHEFDVNQIAYTPVGGSANYTGLFVRVCDDFSNYLIENNVGIKMTKSFYVN